MTDEMLVLANQNKRKSGIENVEFLRGEIENIPLPDNSVDVILSNCVINLSSDKQKVFAKGCSFCGRVEGLPPRRRHSRHWTRLAPKQELKKIGNQ